jgi:uncharacterized protein
MNVLIDTNVLLSAAVRDRDPERAVIFVACEDSWRWIVTSDILQEYENVLRRPKFALSDVQLAEWMQVLGLRTILVASPPVVQFERDPKDAPFLAAILAMPIDILITGDADLLSLKETTPTRILTVAEFVREFLVV